MLECGLLSYIKSGLVGKSVGLSVGLSVGKSQFY